MSIMRHAALAAVLLVPAAAALADGMATPAPIVDDRPVLVLRGTFSERPLGPVAAPPAPERVLTGGQRLWLLEPGSGDLTACQLENTAMVGQRRIACARRSLPSVLD